MRKGHWVGRFDRYILAHLIRVFGFFALVLVGIYWVNRAVILLDQYLSEGQNGALVFEVTLLSVPSIMLIVLPVAGFVASAYTTNRLHADSELVVVQATGYSAFRLVRPFLVFAAILVALMSILAHVIVPASARELNRLEAQLADAISSRLLVPGTFQSPTPGVTVYVRDIAVDGTLEGLLVTDRREPEQETTHRALLVRHDEGPRLVMFQGMAQTLTLASGHLAVTQFEDFTVAIGDLVASPSVRRLDQRELPTSVLLSPTPEIETLTRRSATDLQREAHLRFTQAMLSAGAAVVGFAALMLGGFSRFGLWRQMALAVVLVVLTKVLDNAAIDIAKRDPSQWPLVYGSSLIAAAVCIVLLVIADSTLGARLRRGRKKAGDT